MRVASGMAATIQAGAVLLLALWMGQACATAAVTGRPRGDAARVLFDSVNQERERIGLRPLRWDGTLAMAAERHAERMAEYGAISHQFRGEPDIAERFQAEGARFSAAAENVAVSGSAASLHWEWMHSAGHRANILDANLTELGVGVVDVNGRLYAVEDFSHGVERVSLNEQERRVERLVAGRGLNLLPYKEEARRICDGGHAQAGEARPRFLVRYSTQDLAMLPAALTNAVGSSHYRSATVGACDGDTGSSFSSYRLAVLLF